MNDKKPSSSSGTGIIVVIIIVILIIIGKVSSDEYDQKEKDAYEKQLHKNPSSWTHEEKERYNNTIEYQDNEKNKK